MTAAKTIVSIVLRLGQGLNRIREMLVKSTDSKNWFERQAMLAVVKGVVEKRGLGEE